MANPAPCVSQITFSVRSRGGGRRTCSPPRAAAAAVMLSRSRRAPLLGEAAVPDAADLHVLGRLGAQVRSEGCTDSKTPAISPVSLLTLAVFRTMLPLST